MINQFGFVSEETFSEKMDTQNRFLAALVTAQGGALKPTSWAEIQALVRAGLHKNVFSIGDQLVCKKGNDDLVWDIIGIDHDTPTDSQFTHSMTLQLHDCLPSAMQFDAPEALYYAENGLAAGTYNFTIQNGYDTAYGGGKTYQFEIQNDIVNNAPYQLTFGWGYNTQAVNAKITIYDKDGNQVGEPIGVTEGSSGTSLGTTDGTSTNLNHIHRVRFGSNNYAESAVRQFLNSSAATGSVWAAQTNFDRPPAWNANTAGFMNGLDSDFLAVIGSVQKVTALNAVTDGGGSVTLDDKFFLLSKSEVYGGLEHDINEGSHYPYYSDYSDLSSEGTDDDSNRIKYRGGTTQWWFLRSPDSATGGNVRNVNPAGGVNYYIAGGSGGVAPACNII